MSHNFLLDSPHPAIKEDFGARSGKLSKDGQITPEMIEAAVRSISATETFRKSKRLRELLSFLIERAIDSPGIPVSAELIAAKVFKREKSFNSVEDPIVRTSLCRLRVALAAYYRSPQCNDVLQINLRQREYMLEFTPRVKKTDAYHSRKLSAAMPISALLLSFSTIILTFLKILLCDL